MLKQPERTAETRTNYITAFVRLMKIKPVEKITIAEISESAGYNRSTFYQYFKDIYDLLAYIEDDILSYVNEEIITQIGKEKTEDYFIEGFQKLYAEKGELLKVLLANKNYSNFPYKLKAAIMPSFANQVGLSLAQEEAVFIIDFYLSGIISVFSRWLSTDTPMQPEKYAMLVKQLLEGMRKSELFPCF